MKTKSLIATLFFGITTLYAQNIPSYVPKDGLVGYWPFNGNANDESGNGNNGTVNGATLTNDRNGKVNSAYIYNGIDNYTNLTKSPTIGNQSFSIFSWILTSSNSKRKQIISYGSDNISQGIWLFLDTDNKLHLDLSFTSGPISNDNIIDSTWHFVGAVNNKGEIQLYIDGKPSGNYQNMNPDIINQSAVIGSTIIKDNWYFDGKLDDIAIYNRALSQEEITALYYSGTPAFASTNVFVDAPASVNENENVELSISTEALNSSDNVIAFQTDLTYDSTRYTFVSNNLTGTLNPAGNVVVNSSKNGKLNISYMSQTALNGAGSLVKLKFKANKNLGQGIFSLSDFLYNTTAVTSLKSDTVNTLDVTPPSARINYSQNLARKGDSLLITVKFNEKMAVSPIPQLNLSGQNTLANSNLTKVNDTTYTYWWVVEKGNGVVNVNLATGKDLGGNGIVATPTQNPSFTVLPTLFGDIDTNKSVQAYDAALALQYSVGLNPLPTMDALPWSNWRLAVANVDTLGNVTANDAALILQYSAKLITTFPADAKKRGGDAPTADVTVSKEGNQLVFRTTGTLYGFNVYFNDNFNSFGQPEVSDKNAIIATNINTTTYNVGLASTKPISVNEPFLIIPILTDTDVKGTMDIVANTQEKSLAYGAALSILEINKEMLIVYPNPTKDIVTIKNAQGNTLRILNVEGKEVYNQKMTGNAMDVSLKTLGAKGMYILYIEDANNESIQSKQIILE
jgi:hypothetical protein